MFEVIWQGRSGARLASHTEHREDAYILARIALGSFPRVHVVEPGGQLLLPFLWS